MQELGRNKLFQDYHLCVGQNVRNTVSGDGGLQGPQRLDEAEIGEGTIVTLIDIVNETE